MKNNVLVTAVIPTRLRPALVVRAVRSALAQSYANLEVVVVIDGYDPETEAALGRIRDQRLRAIALTENAGASEARNIGVRAARGEWIALLDDDDEWLPGKIECQIKLAATSKYRLPILSSRFLCRTPAADYPAADHPAADRPAAALALAAAGAAALSAARPKAYIPPGSDLECGCSHAVSTRHQWRRSRSRRACRDAAPVGIAR